MFGNFFIISQTKLMGQEFNRKLVYAQQVAYLGLHYMYDQAPGYKTFFMLNSTKHEISTAHNNENTEK